MTAIRLDQEGTPPWLREMIMLHETYSPLSSNEYDRSDSIQAMWLIRQVLANRVALPWVFATPGHPSEADLMAVPKQFPGFERYPDLPANTTKNIYIMLAVANNPKHPLRAACADHVTDAIVIANAVNPPGDKIVCEVAAWKLAGTRSPGSNFFLYKRLQGNGFPQLPRPCWHVVTAFGAYNARTFYCGAASLFSVSGCAMMRRHRRVLLLSSAIMFAAQGLRADDISDGVLLPGWRSEPAGSALVTDGLVVLAADRVTITLKFSAHRGEMRLVSAGPRFGWIGMGEYYPLRQFPELKVQLDATPMKLDDEFQAVAEAIDITSILRKANIDPTFVARNEAPILPSSTPATVLEQLKQAGAVQFLDPEWIADWKVNRIARLLVQESGNHKLSFTYQPRPSFQYMPSVDSQSPLNPFLYCSTIPELLQALGNPPDPAILRIHEYTLPVGIDGYAPASVTLSVGEPGTLEHHRLLLVACKPDGTALMEREGIASMPVQVGPQGTLHILAISNPVQ